MNNHCRSSSAMIFSKKSSDPRWCTHQVHSRHLISESISSSVFFLVPGIFRGNADETLEEAQTTNMELICRKIRLRESDQVHGFLDSRCQTRQSMSCCFGCQVLDVGCGWGTLVRFMAEKYRATVTGNLFSFSLSFFFIALLLLICQIILLFCSFFVLPWNDDIPTLRLYDFARAENVGRRQNRRKPP